MPFISNTSLIYWTFLKGEFSFLLWFALITVILRILIKTLIWRRSKANG